MRKLVALAIAAILLYGCAKPDPNLHAVQPDASEPVQIPNGEAAVIVGLTVSQAPPNLLGLEAPGPTNLGWVAIDPQTRQRVGTAMFTPGLACGLFSCAAASGKKTDYFMAVLPPGTYAMAWISAHAAMFPTAQFKEAEILYSNEASTFRNFPLEARAIPVAPTFALHAGEVAYVGDLDFDFSLKNEARWTHRYDEVAVRSFLAKTGLVDRVIRRPMTRADGHPLGQGDAVTNKK